jgi:hypothetical protein
MTHLSTKVARLFTAKRSVDPSIMKSAEDMVEELGLAVSNMDRAIQFGRRLESEPSLEWMPSMLDGIYEQLQSIHKSMVDGVDYMK